MSISPPVPMKEYGPHFNEPLSLPPELNWNLQTDRRSGFLEIDNFHFSLILKYVKIAGSEEK